MGTLIQLKNLGGPPAVEDQYVIDTADAFIALYNLAMSRMTDCSDEAERKELSATNWRGWG